MRVSRGVPARGVVTATHVAARQTQTQVNPPITSFQTIFAAVGAWAYLFDFRQMFAAVHFYFS